MFKQPHKSVTALVNTLDYENANRVKMEAISAWKQPYGYIAINTDISGKDNISNDIFDFSDKSEINDK